MDDSALMHSTNSKLSYACEAGGQAPTGKTFSIPNGQFAIDIFCVIISNT